MFGYFLLEKTDKKDKIRKVVCIEIDRNHSEMFLFYVKIIMTYIHFGASEQQNQSLKTI